MEIAALVSGGVDSSVVVHQLKEAGYDPTIFYIRIGMEDKDGYIDCPAERGYRNYILHSTQIRLSHGSGIPA